MRLYPKDVKSLNLSTFSSLTFTTRVILSKTTSLSKFSGLLISVLKTFLLIPYGRVLIEEYFLEWALFGLVFQIFGVLQYDIPHILFLNRCFQGPTSVYLVLVYLPQSLHIFHFNVLSLHLNGVKDFQKFLIITMVPILF